MCNCNSNHNSCGCTPPTTCDCPTFLRSDCVTFSQDLECSSIPKDLTLTDTILALDAYICAAISDMDSKINLINIGTGVGIYAGIDNLGKRKIRTLTSSDETLTITLTDDETTDTENTNNIDLSVRKIKLTELDVAPSSASDVGTLGEVRFTATGIYICIATNTWIKAEAATF